jgi:quercetin dioxygenase-like cupin family protein
MALGETMSRTNEHVYLRTHRIRGRLLRYQLPTEQAALLSRATSSAAGRAGKTLAKEGSLRITQLALRKGKRLPSHQVAGAASVQVLQGRLRMRTASGDIDLAAGALAVLDARVAHSALAVTDCAILITMAMQFPRVGS